MEHMKRVVKTVISGLGANKTEKAIIRAGKSVGLYLVTFWLHTTMRQECL